MDTLLHQSLSHDLRTPLTSVLGYSATLVERWDSLDEAARLEFIGVVYGEALRMAESIELLDQRLRDQIAIEDARSGGFTGLQGLADAS